MMIRRLCSMLCIAVSVMVVNCHAQVPPLPDQARPVIDEHFAGGQLDEKRWYVPRYHWGQGNHGVIPENVFFVEDEVDGKMKSVLVCRAHGDEYDGPLVGRWGKTDRVGGVIVSREFFCSGRFEIVMKIGSKIRHDGGPTDPTRPIGCVPALWTYGYRWVQVAREFKEQFVEAAPMYNPHMPAYNGPQNEYWSEIDFPELGKRGDFDHGLYNTFCQNRHDWRTYEVGPIADGEYHTYTTDWRTELREISDVTDGQVVEFEGYWWVADKAIAFERYLGNPLKRLGPNRYAVYTGASATHWIDGRLIGRNVRNVPAMGGQMTLGVWLPEWGGPAPWKTAQVRFAAIRIWQYDDPGDVRGILWGDLRNNFDAAGRDIDRRQ